VLLACHSRTRRACLTVSWKSSPLVSTLILCTFRRGGGALETVWQTGTTDGEGWDVPRAIGRYRYVLVLYLERPATQRYAVACSLAGRFGYSDLKEAALTEAYVLCIGLSGRRGIGNRLSRVGCDGLEAG